MRVVRIYLSFKGNLHRTTCFSGSKRVFSEKIGLMWLLLYVVHRCYQLQFCFAYLLPSLGSSTLSLQSPPSFSPLWSERFLHLGNMHRRNGPYFAVASVRQAGIGGPIARRNRLAECRISSSERDNSICVRLRSNSTSARAITLCTRTITPLSQISIISRQTPRHKHSPYRVQTCARKSRAASSCPGRWQSASRSVHPRAARIGSRPSCPHSQG